MPIARVRSIVASLLGLALAASICATAVAIALPRNPLAVVPMFVFGASVGAAALGLGSASVLAAVAARGVLVLWLVTSGYALWQVPMVSGRAVAWVLLSAAVLAFAPPRLHSPAARTAFAPVRYRALFLAGAVASFAMATEVTFRLLELAEFFASFGARSAAPGSVVTVFLVALAFAASAVAVLRMRAWGVVLGVLASALAAGAALAGIELTPLSMHPLWPHSVEALLAAAPGVLLSLPVALARAPRRSAARRMTRLPLEHD